MPNNKPLSSIPQQATELAKLGKYSAALTKLDEMGSELSRSVEGTYVRAVCLRKLKQSDDAITALEQVLKLDANYVRAYQELGHILLADGKLEKAARAYETAVKKDSALLASWRALAGIYAKLGNQVAANRARHEAAQLEQLPPALQAVKSHLNRDNLDAADQICREHLQQHKQDVEGMRLLAEIAIKAKILDDAEFILESAVTFEPNHIGARFDYANLLIKRQKFGLAHDIAQTLDNEHPGNKQFRTLLAATLTGIGETESGAMLYRELMNEYPSLHHLNLLLGHAEKTIGRLPSAIEAYQKLYKKIPDFGDAFWSLANTKTYRFTDAEVAHMQDYRERPQTSSIDKVHLNFALGKALEDRAEFDAAFQAYSLGNEQNKELLKYQAPEIQRRIDRQIKVCTAELFAKLEGVGAVAPDPIFVVGLPRAGSTLLEQILASHSQVDGTLELSNILGLSRRLRGRNKQSADEEPQYPRILGELDRDYFRKFGEQYLEDTKVFRQGAPFFIDKMPNNFLHLGLIKLILPNAKVIDARRHPMACCFSGFKQLFAEGQEFTYGLREIGDYYKQYVRLMDHWDEVLPNFVLRVQHEDVVHDLASQVARILEFCGLPFEQSCVEFYKTERNVRTPSSEQVRQPIYTTGLEQWRKFDRHLEPLIEALGPEVLKRYPID